MNIKLLVIGKTENSYIKEGLTEYTKRLGRYVNFELEEIQAKGSSTNREIQISKEAEKILNGLKTTDLVILLDETGEQFTSIGLSEKIASWQNKGVQRIVIICGGPYGFNESVYKRAGLKLSLSKMTFTHQMARLILLEQLYRAYTILKNEKYHH